MIVGLKFATCSLLSLFEGSPKSIVSSLKSIDDKLSLLVLFKLALSGTVTCVSFWSLVKLEFGILVAFDGSSVEIEFLQNSSLAWIKINAHLKS